MTPAAVNRLPEALCDLPLDESSTLAALAPIGHFPEEAKQLGLLLYVVSVVLPALESAAPQKATEGIVTPGAN